MNEMESQTTSETVSETVTPLVERTLEFFQALNSSALNSSLLVDVPQRNATEIDVTGSQPINTSSTQQCLELRFDSYVPWDNPDNLLSAQAEVLMDQLKCAVFLPVLFLIGGPANVINMAVFWKQGLRKRINLCLFALSMADELYLVQCMFINGERMYTLFTTKERYGPVTKWMANHYLVGFFGFTWVSQVMSAIIASERCFCVVSPIRSQIVLTTRTMAIVITIVYVVVVGLYFIVASRYHVSCVFDPNTGVFFNSVIGGEFYHQNKVKCSVFFYRT